MMKSKAYDKQQPSYVTLYNFMSKLYWLLFIQALIFIAVRSQILAIDYGTQYVKASLVHQGAGKAFSIVENPKSQRKFINSLGLYNEERYYEADTLSKRSRGPSNCFIYSHLLIDLHDNPSLIETIKKDLVLEYVKNPEADQLLAKFVLAGFPQGENTISLLETVGMMIKYIKLQAEKAAGQIKDVVLIVPNHWSIHQRKFLVRAAQLADLHVLSLIHENTAAAINYALSQRTTNQSETILFYNLGASSVQMTLAQFKSIKAEKNPKSVESIFIIGDYGQPYVGGLKLDTMIAKFFVQKFQAKYKKTLSQRGYIRLLAQSEKMKLVLSANKEATVFVEGIMDGIDFSATINRREFETLAEETLKSVTSPIKRFLFDHDLRAQDLNGVELIGGGSRIPKLQSLIGQAIGNSSLIGSHINGDEAMVLGAAFYGANSSLKYKVKGINLYDGFNFEMRIVLRNADQTITEQDSKYYFKNVTLFKKKSRYGLTKEVSFKCKQNLVVQIYKEDEKGLQLITRQAINSIQNINETNFKLSLTFQIDPIEIVKVSSVKYLYSKDVVTSYTEKVRKYTKPNKTQQTEEEEDTKEEEKEKEENNQEEKESEEADKAEDSQKQNEDGKSKPEKKKKKKEKIEYETVERFKNVTKNFEKNLQYKKGFHIFQKDSAQSLQKSKRVFAQYESKEAVKRLLAESKNRLEALIYQLKEKLENDEFTRYAQESEINKIKVLVEQKAEWYDDTTSNVADDYRKQFKELNEPVEKIKKRIVEHREKEDVRKRAFDIVAEYAGLTTKIQKGKDWITDDEVAELTLNITNSKKNIEQLAQKLASVPINQDSAFRNKDLIKEAEIVKDQYFILKGKAKPKGFKSEKKEKEEKEKAEQASNSPQGEVNEDEL